MFIIIKFVGCTFQVADLIAYAWFFKHSVSLEDRNLSVVALKQKVEDTFPNLTKEWDTLFQRVLDTADDAAKIVVYNIEKYNGAAIDDAILKARLFQIINFEDLPMDLHSKRSTV